MRSYTCSKRCVSCQATYPDHPIFDISPCCDVTTTVIRKPPDLTWDEAKRIVLNSRFEKYYRRSNSGINEDQQDYLSDPLEVNPEEFRNALKEVLREIEDLTSQDCLQSARLFGMAAKSPAAKAKRRAERSDRYRKRVPTQQDGFPQGKHLRPKPGEKLNCSCGGCNAKKNTNPT